MSAFRFETWAPGLCAATRKSRLARFSASWPKLNTRPELESAELSPEAIRQRASRQARAAKGAIRRELVQSSYEATMTDFMCRVRAGHGEPYEFREYVNTLIKRDYERFQKEWDQIHASRCANCDKRLPLGCGGRLSMESACWHSEGLKSLLL